MLTARAFKSARLYLLQLAFLAQVSAQKEPEWSYENPNWGVNYTQCNGNRQSPLLLMTSKSLFPRIPPLRFRNYDTPLEGDVTVMNVGTTIEINIPVTTSGRRPSISGGMLRSRYEAQSLHFHWGSQGERGAEHVIDDVRYDIEMHIVLKNIYYATMEEATRRKDGLSVLGVMLKIDRNANQTSMPGLNMLFDLLPQLRLFHSKANIKGPVTLGQFLGDLNTKNFFTYSGSLTTPPCSEAVVWNVFSTPLPVAFEQVGRFWDILDVNKRRLINNFRPLQGRERRQIIYRSSGSPRID